MEAGDETRERALMAVRLLASHNALTVIDSLLNDHPLPFDEALVSNNSFLFFILFLFFWERKKKRNQLMEYYTNISYFIYRIIKRKNRISGIILSKKIHIVPFIGLFLANFSY